MSSRLLLTAADNRAVKQLVRIPPFRKLTANRFIAGTTWDQLREPVASLLDQELAVTLDQITTPTRSQAVIDQNVATGLAILDGVGSEGWADQVEICLRPDGFGVTGAEEAARRAIETIADHAQGVGVRVTLDASAPGAVARTLRLAAALRERHPDLACTIAANLKRSEADARALAAPGSRVRLTKGSFSTAQPGTNWRALDIDLSYVRCLKALLDGGATTVVASDDLVLMEIAEELAAHHQRGPESFEFQFRYGVRPGEQLRLAQLGQRVRVIVPFGADRHQYLLNRLSERSPR